MKRICLFLLACTVFSSIQLRAQEATSDERKTDIGTLGIGLGLDHGGIGGNFLVYPQRNIGLFAGVGYAIAGIGFNAGVKFRILPKKSTPSVTPYAICMYGYNTAIYIANAQQYNKLFYGPSIGVGIDIRSRRPTAAGYWSFAILVPFRGSDVQNYINTLQNSDGVTFTNTLLPIGFSIGYKIILF